MDVHQWFYKFSKLVKKCTRRVNIKDVYYPGHKVVRSRANMIASNRGLGTALLIAPPVLVLIAMGIAARSSANVLAPGDHSPSSIPEPPATAPSSEKVVSNLQLQLQESLANLENNKDHVNVVTAAIVAIGLIGAILTIRAIMRRRRGGGGGGKNATDSRYPRGMNNTHRDAHVQTGSLQGENLTLNAGSGEDPFRTR
ncbi:hypothetical protein BN14_04208 [Rhizoctonia solani AG-1 IB]|uniref:Transmembrane protein n=1 Tax=Thanatephorus cucumeris (strain AG1-IB / isolate 7/3/14) TaxID=1108050 RepID=M5BSL0_THACB|nr:hypothetical protein BN14_04208 [Rhizoctonia solani AG-1 IB]